MTTMETDGVRLAAPVIETACTVIESSLKHIETCQQQMSAFGFDPERLVWATDRGCGALLLHKVGANGLTLQSAGLTEPVTWRDVSPARVQGFNHHKDSIGFPTQRVVQRRIGSVLGEAIAQSVEIVRQCTAALAKR